MTYTALKMADARRSAAPAYLTEQEIMRRAEALRAETIAGWIRGFARRITPQLKGAGSAPRAPHWT